MNEQILASAAHASEVKFNGEEKILTTATFDILKILSYDAYQQFRENCFQRQVLARTDKLYFKNAMHLKDE